MDVIGELLKKDGSGGYVTYENDNHDSSFDGVHAALYYTSIPSNPSLCYVHPLVAFVADIAIIKGVASGADRRKGLDVVWTAQTKESNSRIQCRCAFGGLP